ncbi:MAG: hypothetical protein ACOY5B_05190 [Spirochaetota bacterium]
MPKYLSAKDIDFIKTIDTFKDTRSSHVPANRLEEVRKAARKFRSELLETGTVPYFRAATLVNVPYPTRYAFFGVYNDTTFLTPVIHITNRLFIIRFKTDGGVKTLLFSPSDIMANAETRFFKRFAGGFIQKLQGDDMRQVKDAAQKLVAPIEHTVEEWLPLIGIKPEEVDYISYDHLHTQDLRNWLGTNGNPGYFPNAKLLVMRQEWESATGLLPPQKDWYCPNGIAGVDPQKVVLLDDDVLLGPGLALVRTPGHTMGNHSLVVNTPAGVFVSSENGVSADSYAPLKSRNNEIRAYAEKTGMEVILNGNTQESGIEQYISMVMEKEIAGPAQQNPEFYNVFNSSQFSGYWMFPGIRPSFAFEDLEIGHL